MIGYFLPFTTALVTATGVRDVFIAENRYALIATTAGIDILDLNQGVIVGSGTLPDSPTCVTADWTTATGNMYIGTTNSGVFMARYHPSRRIDFTSNLVQTFTTTSTPPLSSNTIRDIDALPGRLLIGTSTGVDFFAGESAYSTRTVASGVNHVHLTTDGGYWATASGNEGEVEVNYNLISTVGTSIITVDFRYSASSDPALPAEPPKDIAVSEGTPRVLSFATPAGALVTQEIAGFESTAARKTLSTDALVTVDFSDAATYSGGRIYVGTVAQVQVYDLTTDALAATHMYDLGTDSTRGQPLVTGTTTVLRTTNIA